MPPVIHSQPRCSRAPCQISQAPPISKRAATTKRAAERATSMPAAWHVCRRRQPCCHLLDGACPVLGVGYIRTTAWVPRGVRSGGMRRMRVPAVGAAALGGVMAAALPGGAVGAPRADLAYHGVVSMVGGRVDLRLTPRNYGPSAVPDATVRLRWSVPPATRQSLPAGCVRSGARVVLCRAGALAAKSVARQIRLRV